MVGEKALDGKRSQGGPDIVKTNAVVDDEKRLGHVRASWAVSAGGGETDVAHSIAASADGSWGMTGEFWGEAVFAKGEKNETKLTARAPGADFFIAKYNPDGSLAWAKSAVGDGYNAGFSIAADDNGSFVATGEFSGEVVFGRGEKNETRLKSSDEAWDIFVAKYAPEGRLEWVRKAFGPGYDEGRGIAVGADRSVLVTGRFWESLAFGEGEPNAAAVRSSGPGWSAFIARYDATGRLVWAKGAAGAGQSEGTDVAASPGGRAIFTGRFSGHAIFGAGEKNETLLMGSPDSKEARQNSDAFVAALGSDGELLWAKAMGGPLYDEGHAIAALGDGSAAVVGLFEKEATFGKGEKNERRLQSRGGLTVFIAKYAPQGEILWSAAVGGGGEYYLEHDLAALEDGSLLIAGEFDARGAASNVDGAGKSLIAKNDFNTSLVKYGPNGRRLWAEALTEKEICTCRAIAAAKSGAFAIVGDFSDTVVFEGARAIHSAGMSDIFAVEFVN